MIVLLDSGPLGLLVRRQKKSDSKSLKCTEWLNSLLKAGAAPAISEIILYETKRGLLYQFERHGDKRIQRLGRLIEQTLYLPLTTEIMDLAAELWAKAKLDSMQTAPDKDINIDIILMAHQQVLARSGEDSVIATENVRHLGRYADAKEWQNIS